MSLEGEVMAVNVDWVCDVFKNRSEPSSSPLCCIVDQKRKKTKFYRSCYSTWSPRSLLFESPGNACKPPIGAGFALKV